MKKPREFWLVRDHPAAENEFMIFREDQTGRHLPEAIHVREVLPQRIFCRCSIDYVCTACRDEENLGE